MTVLLMIFNGIYKKNNIKSQANAKNTKSNPHQSYTVERKLCWKNSEVVSLEKDMKDDLNDVVYTSVKKNRNKQ